MIGVANVGLSGYNYLGEVSQYYTGTNYLGDAGQLETNDWSKGLIVDEDPALHDLSKFLGGSGSFDLLTGGLGKIGLVNKAMCGVQKMVEASSLLSKAARVGSLGMKGYTAYQGVKSTYESSTEMCEALAAGDYARATKCSTRRSRRR